MPNAEAISYTHHSKKFWLVPTNYSFAAKEPVVIVGLNEIIEACVHFPIAFINSDDRMQAAIVFGLQPDENLFVSHNGEWMSHFIPARVRTYPFLLAPLPTNEMGFCVLAESVSASAIPQGMPFFESEGELTSSVKRVFEFLVACHNSRTVTETLVRQISDLGLLQPWLISVQEADRVHQVKDLLRIDEEKFRSLSDSDFLELRKSGALNLIYCQMVSVQNMSRIIALHQARRKSNMDNSQHPSRPVMELDFSSLGR